MIERPFLKSFIAVIVVLFIIAGVRYLNGYPIIPDGTKKEADWDTVEKFEVNDMITGFDNVRYRGISTKNGKRSLMFAVNGSLTFYGVSLDTYRTGINIEGKLIQIKEIDEDTGTLMIVIPKKLKDMEEDKNKAKR